MKKPILLPGLALLVFCMSVRAQSEFPLVDYHVHLKGDLTYEKAVEHSKQAGIRYGVALNCGLGFPTQTDSAASAWLESMKGSSG
jgi:hypothetical protein